MVHNMSSESRRKRRKRSKKLSSSSSYSASSEELSSNANSSISNVGNKVQIREQAEFHMVKTKLEEPQPPSPPAMARPLLPVGLKEGIYQLLETEMLYYPRTDCLLNNTVCGDDKVDAALRDEAMFSLRFLHKVYNLAPECFAHAVNIADRFLARVKVKAKYMSCLATAAYLIAARMIEAPENHPTPDDLVRIARCGGSPADLERMVDIIRVKLRPATVAMPNSDSNDSVDKQQQKQHQQQQQQQHEIGRLENAVTPLHFLSLLAPLFTSETEFQRTIGDLETVLCSVAVYSFRPALLALCVARRHLLASRSEQDARGSGGAKLVAMLDEVADAMQLNDSDVASCDALVAMETLRIRARRSNSRGRRISPNQARQHWPAANSLRYKIQKLQKLQQQHHHQPQLKMKLPSCHLADSFGFQLGTIREENCLGKVNEDDGVGEQAQGLLDIYQLFA